MHIVAAMISSQGATILCVHVTPTLRARGSGRPSRPPREPSPRGGEPESPGGEPDSPGGGADSPGGEPGSPGWSRLPFGLPAGCLGACHVAGLAVPDLFTPATLAAFKSTLSPTCGRGERGEQIRHSRYGPENPAPSDLQWGSTPRGADSTPRGFGSPPEGSRPEFLGERGGTVLVWQRSSEIRPKRTDARYTDFIVHTFSNKSGRDVNEKSAWAQPGEHVTGLEGACCWRRGC